MFASAITRYIFKKNLSINRILKPYGIIALSCMPLSSYAVLNLYEVDNETKHCVVDVRLLGSTQEYVVLPHKIVKRDMWLPYNSDGSISINLKVTSTVTGSSRNVYLWDYDWHLDAFYNETGFNQKVNGNKDFMIYVPPTGQLEFRTNYGTFDGYRNSFTIPLFTEVFCK